jgi:hypothetical protein
MIIDKIIFEDNMVFLYMRDHICIVLYIVNYHYTDIARLNHNLNLSVASVCSTLGIVSFLSAKGYVVSSVNVIFTKYL